MREAPHNIEAEACILGGMMLDPHSIPVAKEIVNRDDFFRPCHQIIWDYIDAMGNVPIDMVTLADKFKADNKLASIGGVEYLVALIDGVPSSANMKYYAEIVKEASVARQLIQLSNNVSENAYSGLKSTEIIETVQTTLFRLSSLTGANTASVGDAVGEYIIDAADAMENGYGKGLPYHIPALDHATGGLMRSEMLVIAGKPGTGKTSLVMTVALNLCRAGYKGVVINAEMPQKQLSGRLLTAIAGVDGNNVRRGKLNADEMVRLRAAGDEIRGLKMAIIARSCTLSDISHHVRYWRHKWGQVDFVVVDYIQQMRLPKCESRYVAVTEMSRGLKDIALENNAAMVALAALKKVGDRRPTNEDLKDSGEIEYAADQIILLHEPDGRPIVKLPGEPDSHMYSVWAKASKDREGSQTPWPDVATSFSIKLRFCKATKLFLPEPY